MFCIVSEIINRCISPDGIKPCFERVFRIEPRLFCYELKKGFFHQLFSYASKVKVAVIATNEELVIATDTYNLTKNL